MAMPAINFVKIIEEYPCLYNNKLPEYLRKDIADKAWCEVAERTNSSVTDCQLRWKNIRNGFVRSLKPAPPGTKQKKMYYMHEELQFIVPFIKAAIHTGEPGNIPAPSMDTEYYIEPQFFNNEEFVHATETPSFEAISNTSKKPKVGKLTNEIDEAIVDWIKKREPISPRKMFLLSLLPDIEKLTDEQMRKFRLKMLFVLEEFQREKSQ